MQVSDYQGGIVELSVQELGAISGGTPAPGIQAATGAASAASKSADKILGRLGAVTLIKVAFDTAFKIGEAFGEL